MLFTLPTPFVSPEGEVPLQLQKIELLEMLCEHLLYGTYMPIFHLKFFSVIVFVMCVVK
jgi:hypothetical protein